MIYKEWIKKELFDLCLTHFKINANWIFYQQLKMCSTIYSRGLFFHLQK